MVSEDRECLEAIFGMVRAAFVNSGTIVLRNLLDTKNFVDQNAFEITRGGVLVYVQIIFVFNLKFIFMHNP